MEHDTGTGRDAVRGAMVRWCDGPADGARVRQSEDGCEVHLPATPSNRLSHPESSHRRMHRRTLAPSHHRTGGFTLIELMVVMSLIVVLAGIGLAVHANSQTRAREAVLKEDLFRLRDA